MLLWRMFLPPTSADHMAVMSSRLNEKRDRYRSDVNYMYLGGTVEAGDGYMNSFLPRTTFLAFNSQHHINNHGTQRYESHSTDMFCKKITVSRDPLSSR